MKSNRIKFAAVFIILAAIIFGWVNTGTDTEEVPYVSIEDLYVKHNTLKQKRFRLGGLVEEGSIHYSDDKLLVDFVIYQGDHRLPVRYTGLTPDMFSDEVEVIIEGKYIEGRLIADNLMTKCASRYEVDLTEKDGKESSI